MHIRPLPHILCMGNTNPHAAGDFGWLSIDTRCTVMCTNPHIVLKRTIVLTLPPARPIFPNHLDANQPTAPSSSSPIQLDNFNLDLVHQR